MKVAITLFLLLLTLSPGNAQKELLADILAQDAPFFDSLIQQSNKYQIQIIYTQVNRDENNYPRFQTHTFGAGEYLYFYPASTVKMPIAFLALEKLNQLNIVGLDKHTPMFTEAARLPQTAAEQDTSAENGLPSLAHYIKKIFLVSDNDAYNRLYEFLGQEAVNEAFRRKGYDQARIIQRLSAPAFGLEENQYTNPVRFQRGDSLLYYQGEVYSPHESGLNPQRQVRGNGYINADGVLVKKPFDFRVKNFVSLSTLERILRSVIFPEAAPREKRFAFSKEDYQMLYQYLSELPGESQFPKHGQRDNYVKFFMYGDDDGVTIPDHIRIFNKVGDAYGFLTDVAYIVDFKNKIEFFVAANIHVNDNEIYNDGNYEYQEIGFPFFGKLGRLLYEYELKRERKHEPDLTKFKVDYD